MIVIKTNILFDIAQWFVYKVCVLQLNSRGYDVAATFALWFKSAWKSLGTTKLKKG